ncbi:MAG: hypothetical protein WD294_15970 [Phycisphaeraceae bacterium]
MSNRASKPSFARVAVLAFGAMLITTLLPMPTAVADELSLGGISRQNVRVTGLRDEMLLYETSSGNSRQAAVASVEMIKIERYPAVGEAEQLAVDGAYAEAAAKYQQALEEIREDDLKVLFHAKLVVSLDRAGESEQAVREFLGLLARDHGAIARAATPQQLPEDAPTREALEELVRRRFAQTSDAVARQPLGELILRLEAEPDSEDAQASPSEGTMLVGRRAQGPARDAIDELIDEAQFEDALAAVDQSLEQGEGELDRLFYQRGTILVGLGRDRDAALAFMRVIIHFPTVSNHYYLPSLLEAGKIFVKLNQPEHARDLWDEAKVAAEGDDAKLEEIEQLLGSLP